MREGSIAGSTLAALWNGNSLADLDFRQLENSLCGTPVRAPRWLVGLERVSPARFRHSSSILCAIRAASLVGCTARGLHAGHGQGVKRANTGFETLVTSLSREIVMKAW